MDQDQSFRAEQFWKHQLSNLNKVMLWMLCDDAISDEAVLTPLVELISWLTSCKRLLSSEQRHEE